VVRARAAVQRARALPIRRARLAQGALATWFVTLSLARLSVLVAAPFTDVHLYLRGTAEWLRGGDPWSVHIGTVYYAAAPPSLLPMAPFALLPEPVAVAILLALGIVASLWTLRRLSLPWWWITWPPLVDNLANGNPQIFLVPLLLSGHAWLAPIVKAYAGAPLLVALRLRMLAVTAAVVVVTAPLLPWPLFLNRLTSTASLLSEQSQGGMSAWYAPLLLLPAGVAALLVMGRRRGGWWFVPVLWPSTQWYYSLLAMPALTPLAAAILAAPVQGSPVVAAVIVAIGMWREERTRGLTEWSPGAVRRALADRSGNGASRRSAADGL
jgi:hypothetical protein